eukprot:357003-Chlamydomonas_euryale.AAC.4
MHTQSDPLPVTLTDPDSAGHSSQSKSQTHRERAQHGYACVKQSKQFKSRRGKVEGAFTKRYGSGEGRLHKAGATVSDHVLTPCATPCTHPMCSPHAIPAQTAER